MLPVAKTLLDMIILAALIFADAVTNCAERLPRVTLPKLLTVTISFPMLTSVANNRLAAELSYPMNADFSLLV